MNEYMAELLNIVNKIDVKQQDIDYFQEEEVGITHLQNNSVVAIRDNGCIDAFVKDMTGIRLDPEAQSANIFSPKINLYGTRTHIRTDPYNFLWNGMKFNPELQQWCKDAPLAPSGKNPPPNPKNFKLKCYYEYAHQEDGEWVWEDAEILIAPYLPDTYKETFSDEVKDLIAKLGITI